MLISSTLPRTSASEPSQPAPLAQAHAHNDYLHARPLLDALDHGFASVEADIFLVEGKLLVAHTRSELKPERTLQALYLDPLRARIKANGGSVYRGGGRFTLLVDIKTAGVPTYTVLALTLGEYADMLSVVHDGKVEQRAVDVVISGDRPTELLAAESVRYAGLDGRLSDLDSKQPASLMPLVSDNWAVHFQWKGHGEIGEADRKKLADAVAKAHAHGRKIRFWATPETVDAWRVLRDAGVDLINTDNLAGLEKLLRSEPPKK